MNILIDASLIVAASVEKDRNHKSAYTWLSAHLETDRLFLATHTIAETYAGLTRNEVGPANASEIINNLIRQIGRDQVIELDVNDYLAAVHQVAGGGLVSGIIYDAILARTARKARVRRIATLNRKHFRLIWAEADLIVPLES